MPTLKRGANWRGGRSLMATGYVRLWLPEHSMANSDGYALEHRVVLHDSGIEIPPGYHVHHINGVKHDNRIENLEVMSASSHLQKHAEQDGVVNQFGIWKSRSLLSEYE